MDYADLMLEIEDFISHRGLTHDESIMSLLNSLLEATEED